jgi:phosphatidylglycerophosphatase A
MTLADSICLFLATLGPIGRIPPAPGTWGSAVAVLAAPLLFLPLTPLWRILLLVALFGLGSLVAGRAEKLLHEKDPGQVIIDEVVGQWLVFLPFAAPTAFELGVGFVLFRLFDVTKPPPVRASENWLPGGAGVMIDDVLAGLYACLGLALLHWLRIHGTTA